MQNVLFGAICSLSHKIEKNMKIMNYGTTKKTDCGETSSGDFATVSNE